RPRDWYSLPVCAVLCVPSKADYSTLAHSSTPSWAGLSNSDRTLFHRKRQFQVACRFRMAVKLKLIKGRCLLHQLRYGGAGVSRVRDAPQLARATGPTENTQLVDSRIVQKI